MFTIGINWKVNNNILQVTFFKPKGISILPKIRGGNFNYVHHISFSLNSRYKAFKHCTKTYVKPSLGNFLRASCEVPKVRENWTET